MDLEKFQALIEEILSHQDGSEATYVAFCDASASSVIIFHLENSIAIPETRTQQYSIVLFDRLLSVFGDNFLTFGDSSFHEFVHTALFQFLSNPGYSSHMRSYIATNIAQLGRICTSQDSSPSFLPLPFFEFSLIPIRMSSLLLSIALQNAWSTAHYRYCWTMCRVLSIHSLSEILRTRIRPSCSRSIAFYIYFLYSFFQ
jgi:hypothetical protein